MATHYERPRTRTGSISVSSSSSVSQSGDPRLRQRSPITSPLSSSVGASDRLQSPWLESSATTRPTSSTAASNQRSGQNSKGGQLPPRLLRSLEELIESDPFDTEVEAKVAEEPKASSANFCSACNKAFKTREVYEQHIMGKEHIANMKEQRDKERMAEENMKQGGMYRSQTEMQAQGEVYSFCQVCKLSCYDELSWNAHVSGNDHIVKLKSYEKTIMGLLQQSKSGQIQLPFLGGGDGNSSQNTQKQSTAATTSQYYQGQEGYQVTSGQEAGYAAEQYADDYTQYGTHQGYHSNQGQYQQYEGDVGMEQEAGHETVQPPRAASAYAGHKAAHYSNMEEYYPETQHEYAEHEYEEPAGGAEWHGHHPRQRRSYEGDTRPAAAQERPVAYMQQERYAEQYHETEQEEREGGYSRPARRGHPAHAGRPVREGHAYGSDEVHAGRPARGGHAYPSDEVHAGRPARGGHVYAGDERYEESEAGYAKTERQRYQEPEAGYAKTERQIYRDPEGGYARTESAAPRGRGAHSLTPRGGTRTMTPRGGAHAPTPRGGAHSLTPRGGTHIATPPRGASHIATPPRGASHIATPPRGATHIGTPRGSTHAPTQRGGTHAPTQRGGAHASTQRGGVRVMTPRGGQQEAGARQQRQYETEHYEAGYYDEATEAYYGEAEHEADYYGYEEEAAESSDAQYYTAYDEDTEGSYAEASYNYHTEAEHRDARGERLHFAAHQSRGPRPARPEARLGVPEQRVRAATPGLIPRGARPAVPSRGEEGRFRRPQEGASPRFSAPQKPGDPRFPTPQRGEVSRYGGPPSARGPTTGTPRPRYDSAGQETRRSQDRMEMRIEHRAEERLHDTSSYSANRFCPLCDMQLVNASEWDKHVFGPKHARYCRLALEEVGEEGFLNKYGDLPIFTGLPPSAQSVTEKSGSEHNIWYCPKCGNDNFAFRTVCHYCPGTRPKDFVPSEGGNHVREMPRSVRGSRSTPAPTGRGYSERDVHVERRFAGSRPREEHEWPEETEEGWYEERGAGRTSRFGPYETTSRDSYGAVRPRPEERRGRDQNAMRDIASLIEHLELSPTKKKEIHDILMKHIKENPDLNMETLKSLVKTFMSLQSENPSKAGPYARGGRAELAPRGPSRMVRPGQSGALMPSPRGPSLQGSRFAGPGVKPLVEFRGGKPPRQEAGAEAEHYPRRDPHVWERGRAEREETRSGREDSRDRERNRSRDSGRPRERESWRDRDDRSRSSSYDYERGTRRSATSSLDRDYRTQGRPEVKKYPEPERNKPDSRSSRNDNSSSGSSDKRNGKDSKNNSGPDRKDKTNDPSAAEKKVESIKQETKPQKESTVKESSGGTKDKNTKESSSAAPQPAGKNTNPIAKPAAKPAATSESKDPQKTDTALQQNKNNPPAGKGSTPQADNNKSDGTASKPDDKKPTNEKEKPEAGKTDTKLPNQNDQKPKDAPAAEKPKPITAETKETGTVNQPKVSHFSTNNSAEKITGPARPPSARGGFNTQTSTGPIIHYNSGAERGRPDRGRPDRGRGRPPMRGHFVQNQDRSVSRPQTEAEEVDNEVQGVYDERSSTERPPRGRGSLPSRGRGLLGEGRGTPLVSRGQPRVLRAGTRGSAASMRGRGHVQSLQATEYGPDDTPRYELPAQGRGMTPGGAVRGTSEARGRGEFRGRGEMRGRGELRGRGGIRGRGETVVRGRGEFVRGRGEYRGMTEMRGRVRGRGEVRGRGAPPTAYRRPASPSHDLYAEHGIKRLRTF